MSVKKIRKEELQTRLDEKQHEAHQLLEEGWEQIDNRHRNVRKLIVFIGILAFFIFALQSILLDTMGLTEGFELVGEDDSFGSFIMIIAMELLPMMLVIGGYLFWYSGPIKKIYDMKYRGEEIPEELYKLGMKRFDRLIFHGMILQLILFAIVAALGISADGTQGSVLFFSWAPKITMGLGLATFYAILTDFIVYRPIRKTFHITHFESKIIFLRSVPNLTFFAPLLFILNGLFIFSNAVINMISGAASQFDINRERLQQTFGMGGEAASGGQGAPPPPPLEGLGQMDFSALTEMMGGMALLFIFIVLPALLVFGVIALAQRAKFKDLNEKIGELARGSGDLTQKIKIQSEDEFAIVASRMNDFIESLRNKLQIISQSAGQVSHSSGVMHEHLENTSAATEEMVASVNQVSRTTTSRTETIAKTGEQLVSVVESLDRISASVEHQAAFVDQTSSAINEMAASIASVTQSTKSANELSHHLKLAAREGEGAVTDSIEAVKAVETSSVEVNNLVSLITETSETTNLLAMNAAIEAAHAGDAGKGFAVVAGEVRRLAEDSASGAGQITKQIKTMVSKVVQGVQLSEEAGESLAKVISDVEKTSGLMEGIALSMDEQNTGTQEILKSIGSLVDATATIREVAAEQKSKNEQMRQSVDMIIQAFNEINMATEEQALGAKEIVGLISSLQDVARENQAVVKTLSEAFAGFKL